MRPCPPGGSSSEHAPRSNAHAPAAMRPLLLMAHSLPVGLDAHTLIGQPGDDVLRRAPVELRPRRMQEDVLRRVVEVVEAVRQIDRHGLGHDDRRVLVDAPHDALLEAVQNAAHGLVGVLEPDGELLHGGVLARGVDDGRGPPDEVGKRDEIAVGRHCTVLPARSAFIGAIEPADILVSVGDTNRMWVLFDLNGTLVDPAVLLDPPELGLAALDEANMMAMITVIDGRRVEFKTLLDAALRRGLERAGRDPGEAEAALRRLPEMPAYPEVPAALETLKDHQLAILTQSSVE